MSGNSLLDTNILIFLSKKVLTLEDIAQPDKYLSISVISYMEALGYSFCNKEEEEIINSLCATLGVIQLDPEIIQETIQIRRGKKIKLPDAIIFSTAKLNKLDLITANEDDFKGLNGTVKIFNPFKKSSTPLYP